jgi:hypothetical protein
MQGGSIKEVQEYLTEWWIQNFAKMVNPQFTVWNEGNKLPDHGFTHHKCGSD